MVYVRIVQVFAVLNILLLAGLLYVWGSNWWRLRSKHTLGLALFCLNGWITNSDAVPRPAQITLAGLRLMEFGGLAFLTWVTWD
ncbi:hypothetical protein BRD02_05085 [Halobacteriales archaeon QS_8_69_73]|nr:MAG: hypothetical protein BRD02_05085 [Halobacteriales archaeon QS_8_69_73]